MTAVLALTAGTALTITPAMAGPVPGPAPAAGPAAEQGAAAVATLPQGSRVLSAGATGFLSVVPNGFGPSDYRWTTYEDGSSTLLNRPNTSFFGNNSDIVWGHEAGRVSYSLYDMTRPSNVVGGISHNNGTYVAAAVGSGLVATTEDRDTGAVSTTILRNSSGTSSTPVPGIPGDARLGKISMTTPGTAVFGYEQGRGTATRYYLAAVDTFTGQVLETRPGTTEEIVDPFLSATHWSWVEYVGTYPTTTTPRARLATAPRDGGATTYTDLGPLGGGKSMHTSILGDWVAYARTGGADSESPSALYPLTARPLGGGTPVKLLDHVQSATPAPDGSLVVRGGTVAQGEGVYRVTPNDADAPTVTMIATTNTPTALTYVSDDVPAVVDLDRNAGKARFTWTLSQPAVDGTFTLRHTRTGKTQATWFNTSGGTVNPENKVTVDWAGMLGPISAYNGDYTWEFRAKPKNGIGPELKRTGALKVVRKALPHDYTDNGTPDVLARDSAGRLWRDDLVKSNMFESGYATEHKLVGSGWNGYNQVEAVGNVAGAPAGDVVARDRDGVLWLYLGKGDGGFATRLKVGPGWNAYNKITGGSDVNNDGWSDLFATDTSGVLWLYKGTGNWRTPYGSRTRVGGGWGAMNQITATGNLGGTVHGDLVARDTTGVLWLYPSTGTGTFGTRVRIGGGWGGYTQLVGAGDIDGDGRADLFAYSPSGGSYLHKGTGNLSAPFVPRTPLPVYAPGHTQFNLIG
ncbi:FG-GAP repeat domain-containing protein [Streptomyces sp. NPDC056501]|uniref:FG-GAP repeat domain-containing protein n=1 Tax=Streptomyces sp. NPDC056501 TaxID=3345841 RepID=UPI0036A47D51